MSKRKDSSAFLITSISPPKATSNWAFIFHFPSRPSFARHWIHQRHEYSPCAFQWKVGQLFLLPSPRGITSLIQLSLWTTRDWLTKIEKKNTFHHPFLSRCLNASAIFQLPYDHSEHRHSCQQERKQESPRESDLTEDRFVTSLQVENRSPTAQKGTGHFSTLISGSYGKCTEHLMEWNLQSVACFWNNSFLTDPSRTRWQWICKVTWESAELPLWSQTLGRTGRDWHKIFLKPTVDPMAPFYKWAIQDQVRYVFLRGTDQPTGTRVSACEISVRCHLTHPGAHFLVSFMVLGKWLL